MTKKQKNALRKGAQIALAQPDNGDPKKKLLKKGAKAFLTAHPDEDEDEAKEAFHRAVSLYQAIGLSDSAAVHAVLGQGDTRGLVR